MRVFYSAIALLALTACEQHGDMFPLDAQKFLSDLEGPKVPSIQDTQKEEARSAERAGNYTKAAQIYQQILEKDQNNIEVMFLLGDSFRRNGEYDKSINVYDSILARDPANLSARESKGLALLSKGDFDTPTLLFQDVLKIDNTRWKSLNGLGVLFVTRNLYTDAMAYFDEAMKYSPNNIAVMNNLGLTQALNKQYDQSIDTLLRASAGSAVGSVERKRIDLNTALVYASAGKLTEAKKIAELYLTGPELNNNLGLYAHLSKDDNLAKSYLNMALTESKTHYNKAWDNLETLNSKSSQNKAKPLATPAQDSSLKKPEEKKQDSKSSEKTLEKPKKEEKSDKKATDDKKSAIPKETKNLLTKPAAKPDAKPSPTVIRKEEDSLGKIIADEIKKDVKVNKKPEPVKKVEIPKVEKPQIIMPDEIPTDDVTPIGSLEKSLGTVKIPK